MVEGSCPPAAPEPRSEVRCKVCSCADKQLTNGGAIQALANRLLLVPMSYPDILDHLEPLMADWPPEARFSRYSLRRHAQRHLKWEESALRQIADRRSEQVAEVGSASRRLLDATVVLETVRQRGLDLLLQGEIKPNVRDLLAATSTLQELETAADGELSPAYLLSQLNTVINIIREEVPEERWPHIVARFEEAPSGSLDALHDDPVFDELSAELDDFDA